MSGHDKKLPKVMILGSTGQLGRALLATEARDLVTIPLARSDLDLTDFTAIRRLIDTDRPDLIINAAAIARPEYAEDEQELALAVNARAVETLARAAKLVDAALLHISTDHVFDGSLTRSYTETDHASPLNMYGATKLLGEELAQLACPRTAILRTSSLHAPWGRNQIVTALAKAERGGQVRAAADRIASPTSAEILAEICMAIAPLLINADAYSDYWGVTHVSAHGECSDATLLTQALGSAGFNPELVAARRIIDWPTTAAYPRSTPLDCARMVRVFGIQPRPWQDHLARTLSTLRSVVAPEAA